MSLHDQFKDLSDLTRSDLFELFYIEAADRTARNFSFTYEPIYSLIDRARIEWISLYMPLMQNDYSAAKFVLLGVQCLIEACSRFHIIHAKPGPYAPDIYAAFARTCPDQLTALNFGMAIYCLQRTLMPVATREFILPEYHFDRIQLGELKHAVELMKNGSYGEKSKGFIDIFRHHTKGMVDPS